jgi:HPt (histidine-containing phosphotransfer) domain-containing protein
MRLGMTPVTAFIVSILWATGACSEPRPIKGETIKSLISGGTIQLDTPIGATLPLNFMPDGTVSGRSVVLAFYLGSATDQGQWWIDGNKLCTKFTRWFDREKSCLTIRPEGRKFAWTKDNGDTGTASIISNTQKLYGNASALGASSAAAVVRNVEERAAQQAHEAAQATAKPVQLAVIPVKPQPMPKPKPAPVIKDDPNAWLPMSVVKAVAKPAPIKVAAAASAAAVTMPVPKKPAPSPTYRVARVNEADVLNVRSAPTGDASVTGSIPANAAGLKMMGICQAEWCPVGYGQQSGWVNRLFIELE